MKRLLIALFLVAGPVFARGGGTYNSWVYIDGRMAPPVSDWGTLQENASYQHTYSIVNNPGAGLASVTIRGSPVFVLDASGCPAGAMSCTAAVSLDTPTPGDYSATLTACSSTSGHFLGHCTSQQIVAHVQ